MLEVDEVVPNGNGNGNGTGPSGGTWVSQGDAATRTGFSVSAIRKWRRLGVVAERKMIGPGGMERIEVRLEDVLARAALQPERPRPEPPPEAAGTRTGAVLITIGDLESLFERMVMAERRAEKAETEVESLESWARYMSGQLAELRRQLEAGGSQQVAAPVPPPPPALQVVARQPEPVARAERQESPPNVHPGEEPGRRLRRLYLRLDEYRRHAEISPEAEVQRQRLLNEYDKELIAACRTLGIATERVSGAPLTVGARAGLTRALAQAGIDVRSAQGEPDDQRGRRPRPGWRS